MNIFLDAALAYAAQGIPVFPLSPGTRIPSISREQGGHGFYDATTDEVTIRGWWKRWPRANIGIPTGAASGWVVLDIDPRNGGDHSLTELQDLYGPLPMTRTACTPRGGWHFYFRHPGDGVRIPCDTHGKLGHGIDVKGDGGYVVAPPSRIANTATGYVWKAAES